MAGWLATGSAGIFSGAAALAVYQGSGLFPGIVAAVTASIIANRFNTATEIYMELVETLLENPVQMLITFFFIYYAQGASTKLIGADHIIYGAGASLITVCMLMWIGKYI
jgi:hypothetical protein